MLWGQNAEFYYIKEGGTYRTSYFKMLFDKHTKKKLTIFEDETETTDQIKAFWVVT
jgi:hypothetical protein